MNLSVPRTVLNPLPYFDVHLKHSSSSVNRTEQRDLSQENNGASNPSGQSMMLSESYFMN